MTYTPLYFCKTKREVDEITDQLIQKRYMADALHGDFTQQHRNKILKKFKDKRSNILVATDVAARGIDINDLTLVVNFSLPQQSEAYVHRIGRTGRAGKTGKAITIISSDEHHGLMQIQKRVNAKILKQRIPKPEDVKSARNKRLFKQVESSMSEKTQEEYKDMAQALLSNHSPVTLVANLLQSAFATDTQTDNSKIDDLYNKKPAPQHHRSR
jgi:Superfamily II DNA and RNA helicases